jgi:predicted  nucleic acid-binding Zn-ribbon protein
MNEEPTKDLATRAFQKRVLDEFAAVRAEQAAMRSDITEMRSDITEMRNDIAEMRNDIVEIRMQQASMAKNMGALDHRLTSLEERVDARLKETRPIWQAVQEQLQKLNDKFDILLHEFYDARAEIKNHGRRIGELERRVLS